MPGFTVRIESHAAPPPFGDEDDYGAWPRRDLSYVDLNTVTQSALVVSHPPLETELTTQRETAQLTVTSYIRIGSGSGAQVVVCTVEQPGKQPFQAVAKIFDAMYYRFADDPDAFHLPEEYRLGVLAKAMDIHVRVIHRGLYHGDLAGRNADPEVYGSMGLQPEPPRM